MRISKIEIENFRCFKKLSLDFCMNCTEETPDGKGGMTVFVAANGQGKTAILDAVKFLLGIFLSRFPKISVPRTKDSDFRDEWEIKQTGLWKSGDEVKKLPRAPYMRLKAEAEFPVLPENKKDGCSPVEWDIVQKRDKSEQTKKLLPNMIGTKQILQQADEYIDFFNREESVPLPVIAYYNTERAVIRNKPERRRGFQKVFQRFDAYIGALDNDLNYKKMIEWFCFLEDNQRRKKEELRDWDYQSIEYKTIQLAVEKMLPGFRNLRTTLNPLDLVVDIEDENDLFKTCRIDSQLSDGYKIVLVLVLDIVSRILEANSSLPKITPEQLLETEGIVLIDEVDLHLHPSWQQRILIDLQRTFPGIQFIVTTHSPQVVSSVPRECVRILDHGQILPFEKQTQGVESQEILSQIFGTDPAPQNDSKVQMLNNYADLAVQGKAESEEGKKIYRDLVSHFGEQYHPLQRIEIQRKFIAKRKG